MVLLGQRLSKLFGQKSDPPAAVRHWTNGSYRLHAVLYDKSGQPAPIIIRYSLVDASTNRFVYNFELTRSAAVSVMQASELVSTPRALVSLQPPHAINVINDALRQRFSTQKFHGQIVGQTVDMYHNLQAQSRSNLQRTAGLLKSDILIASLVSIGLKILCARQSPEPLRAGFEV